MDKMFFEPKRKKEIDNQRNLLEHEGKKKKRVDFLQELNYFGLGCTRPIECVEQQCHHGEVAQYEVMPLRYTLMERQNQNRDDGDINDGGEIDECQKRKQPVIPT